MRLLPHFKGIPATPSVPVCHPTGVCYFLTVRPRSADSNLACGPSTTVSSSCGVAFSSGWALAGHFFHRGRNENEVRVASTDQAVPTVAVNVREIWIWSRSCSRLFGYKPNGDSARAAYRARSLIDPIGLTTRQQRGISEFLADSYTRYSIAIFFRSYRHSCA